MALFSHGSFITDPMPEVLSTQRPFSPDTQALLPRPDEAPVLCAQILHQTWSTGSIIDIQSKKSIAGAFRCPAMLVFSVLCCIYLLPSIRLRIRSLLYFTVGCLLYLLNNFLRALQSSSADVHIPDRLPEPLFRLRYARSYGTPIP